MTALRADFVDALRRLAAVFDAYQTETSGDFDVAPADAIFDGIMADQGVRQEDRSGHLQVGYYHPEVPTIGVQLVSGRLFEGRTDPQRITLLPVEGGGTIALAPIEDMIADRLGQYAGSGERDVEMLDQARLVAKLAGDIDRPYLIKRVREETGDPALLGAG